MQNTQQDIRRLLIKTGVIIAAFWIALTFVFGVYHLKGNRMFPSLRDGDLILTYRLEAYKPGEVVAYHLDGTTRFGRITAFPGNTVEIAENGILVNGTEQGEQIFYPTEPAEGGISYPYTVPEDSFFLLNDYRPDKSDSRSFGAVAKTDLEGKVIYIFRRRGF